jgi:hypothetical protein
MFLKQSIFFQNPQFEARRIKFKLVYSLAHDISKYALKTFYEHTEKKNMLFQR